MNKAKRPKWSSLLHKVDDMVEMAYLIVMLSYGSCPLKVCFTLVYFSNIKK